MQEAFRAGAALTHHLLEPPLVFLAFIAGMLWPLVARLLILLGVFLVFAFVAWIFDC